MNTNWSVTKAAKTTTMIEAALVIVPAVTAMPRATAARGVEPAVPRLLDPREDEQVVVHRKAEQDREDEDRDPALDDPAGHDPELLGEPAVVEDQHQHAERRAG